MRNLRNTRAFGGGILLGLLLGSAVISAAGVGFKGWGKGSNDYKLGYITGFLEMAHLARNLHPDGWVDQKYPYYPQVRPYEWNAVIAELYKKPENQKYDIDSILQLASKEMEKKYGKAVPPFERVRQRMLSQLERVAKRKQAQAQKSGAAPAPQKPGEVAGTVVPEPKAGTNADASATRVVVQHERQRKWCRCDGTDPKQARAERRAKAEAEEKAEEAEEKKRAAGAAPPVKTPPNAKEPARPAVP